MTARHRAHRPLHVWFGHVDGVRQRVVAGSGASIIPTPQCMAGISEGAAPGVHAAVGELLTRLPRGPLLDVPAGYGNLSDLAKKMGFDVTSGDIDPPKFEAPGLSCQRVDLNGPLPFPDGAFAVVLCVEGIEHIENPFQLLRELRRVLRPGGVLLLTTPNILSLTSRVRLMLSGTFSYFDFERSLLEEGHIAPIGAPELVVGLVRAGFTLTSLGTNRIKPSARKLRPLAPLIRRTSPHFIKDPELRRLLTSDAVLLADILIVEAEASGPVAPTSAFPFVMAKPST